jgi:hypothetical protein
MSRHSRAGGAPVKTRTRKRRTASKDVRSSSAFAGHKTIARLTRELNEAREQTPALRMSPLI